MGYRGRGGEVIAAAVGRAMVWRQAVSGASGVQVAGFGAAMTYRERVVTGLIVRGEVRERATDGGQVMAGRLTISLPVKPGREDELRWDGRVYRVASEAVESAVNGRWVVEVE